jgi:TolC family type I secretion outer membrane protein
LFAVSVHAENKKKTGDIQDAELFAQNLAKEKRTARSIDPAKLLSLVDVIDIALRNNPSTRAAWEKVRLQEAVKKQSESKLFPALTATGSVTRERETSTQKTQNYNDLGYGPKLNLTYLLFDFGARSGAIEQAVEQLSSANFQFNQVYQDLLRNVENSYYQLYSAQATLEAALEDVENAKISYEAAKARFEVGLAAKLDVLQAKSGYENSLYLLEDTKGEVKTSRANLAKAMGFSADTKFEIASYHEEAAVNIKEQDVSRLIHEALKKRPDLASLRTLIEADKAAIKVANSSLWPTLNLGSSAARNWYNDYSSKRNKEHDYDYSVYLEADWSVFDGFYNLYQKRRAQAQLALDAQNLVQAELSASADVWMKYYGLNTARSKLTYSKAYLETSKTTYDLALESYKVGLKSILDLLNAQSQLSDARSKLVDSRKDLFVAVIDLAHATGTLYAKTSYKEK